MVRNIFIGVLALILAGELYLVYNHEKFFTSTGRTIEIGTPEVVNEKPVLATDNLASLAQGEVEISGKKFNVWVASSAETRSKGLSGQVSLADDRGMLFVFEAAGTHSFWMQDTKINLDIIFINEDKIVEIAHNLPAQKDSSLPPATYVPVQSASYALEINGGLSKLYGFEVGQPVKINLMRQVAKASLDAQVLPARHSISVPFAVQAPFAKWYHPYEEACEEATILMAVKYFEGKKTIPLAEIDDQLLKMVVYEEKVFGHYVNSDMKEVASLLEGFYGISNYEIINNADFEDIKLAIVKGYAVILPAAGKLLNNPYFVQPGPPYHTVVVTGYDDTTKEFITNDPGTIRGEGLRYSYETIEKAWHDWTGSEETLLQGGKNLLVIKGR
ncbi:hypothetical protein C4553_01740 [Candidatus Parcubacteria bacterium]|nr:MAG: hypothetical protein C4553_01740 [Candidatus Parcubacteria bacterium]